VEFRSSSPLERRPSAPGGASLGTGAGEAASSWCFPRRGALPTPRLEGFRLSSRAGEALAGLLPLLGCGEEAAALAFDRLAAGQGDDPAARRALRKIGVEEATHAALLSAVAGALPPPPLIAGRLEAARRFHRGLAQGDVTDHLARIAATDAAVCTILARLARPGTPLAGDAVLAAVLRRIQTDEAGHVVVSRDLALQRREHGLADVAAPARRALASLLSLVADELEALAFDPSWLETLIARLPAGLFGG